MKRILICIALCMPLMAWAQSELTPEQQLEKARQEAEAAKQAVKEAKKAAKEAKKAAKKRKKNDEIQRQIEEAQREAAQYKAEAERIKAQNESTVKVAQEQAEEGRKQAEIGRKQVEEGRKQIEAARQAATSSGGWTIPEAVSKSAVQEEDKVVKRKDSDERNLPKYLAGAVPQDNEGNVVFTLNLNVPGKTAQQIYERSNLWLKSLVEGDEQIQSRIALTNQQTHESIATMSEWITFQRNFLSTDRTKMNYVIQTKCDDGHFTLTLSRIRYIYEEGRDSELKISAEEWITDEEALNKKGKLRNGSAKFRRATIDRKNVLFNEITSLLK